MVSDYPQRPAAWGCGILNGMTVFAYSAADQSGKIVKGEREAPDQTALGHALKAEGFLLLDAEEKKGVKGFLHVDLGQVLSRLRPVSLVEKMFFARNLSVMVAAGLSLTRSLDALAEEAKNPKFKRMVTDCNEAIAKGKTLAEGLSAHKKIFGELFINMIEVGEATGKLTSVLKLLANQMKRDHALRKRVKGAMIYPVIILLALTGIGTMMMIYVVPTITSVLIDLHVPLPVTTRAIIWVSNTLVHRGIYVLMALVAVGAGVWRVRKTAGGRTFFDRWSLKLPVFGSLIRQFNTARFCRTLSYLLTAGVPIVRSLEITAGVLSNTLFREAVRGSAGGIQKGKQLNALLAEHRDLFQPLVVQMVAVGEETGKISEMLLRLALFFEEEVAAVTKNLSTIIEPILMVIIGIAVGFFAVSMLQPIYTSLGSIGA